jgi:hypothetical protein
MGSVRPVPLVRFFASIMLSDEQLLAEVEEKLQGLLGAVEEKTAMVSFSYSDYYKREMGDLSRYFAFYLGLAPRESLVDIKLRTNEIEEEMSVSGRRRVNIDPGYVALEHVVLATTKGFSHRVHLGRGIFGDLTLIFRNGRYKPLEWTYPDYASEETMQMFSRWRQQYKEQLQCQKA